jgi:hypothetical protein
MTIVDLRNKYEVQAPRLTSCCSGSSKGHTTAPELIIEDDEKAESLDGGILPKAVNPFARRQ